MRKSLFLVTLMIISLFAVYMVSALWPFTGRVVDNPQELCVDSDNAIDEYSAGIVIFRKAVDSRSDYFADVCILRGTRLREYYCDDNGRVRKKTIRCLGGCEEEEVTAYAFGLSITRQVGKCARLGASCQDSDEGSTNPIYVKGTVTNELGVKNTDSCDRNTLTEYSCDNNEIISSTHVCDYRCSGGACIQASFTCEDSDEGNNAVDAGVVKFVSETNTSYYKDECKGKKIKEYYCSDTGIKKALVACKGVCRIRDLSEFGQTFTAAYCEPQVETCTDSDSDELDPSIIAGTVTATDVYGNEKTYEDSCRGKNVLEYFCDGNIAKSEIKECDDVCVDSACIVRGDLCSDSDDGKKPAVKGTTSNQYGSFTDFCSNEKRLVEGYCKQGDSAVATSKTNPKIHLKTFICTNNCQGGVCLGFVEESEETED